MAAGSTERTSGYFGDQTPTELKSKTTTIVFDRAKNLKGSRKIRTLYRSKTTTIVSDRYNVLNVRDPLRFFARLNIYYKAFLE
jgi:hypothetical protein